MWNCAFVGTVTINSAWNEQYESYDHELKTEPVKDYPVVWSVNYSW